MHLGTNNFQVCITSILTFISVLLKPQALRATPKYWPIEKIFGTDFFFIIGTDWKGATTAFQTIIFVGHTNVHVCMCVVCIYVCMFYVQMCVCVCVYIYI